MVYRVAQFRGNDLANLPSNIRFCSHYDRSNGCVFETCDQVQSYKRNCNLLGAHLAYMVTLAIWASYFLNSEPPFIIVSIFWILTFIFIACNATSVILTIVYDRDAYSEIRHIASGVFLALAGIYITVALCKLKRAIEELENNMGIAEIESPEERKDFAKPLMDNPFLRRRRQNSSIQKRLSRLIYVGLPTSIFGVVACINLARQAADTKETYSETVKGEANQYSILKDITQYYVFIGICGFYIFYAWVPWANRQRRGFQVIPMHLPSNNRRQSRNSVRTRRSIGAKSSYVRGPTTDSREG
mmetsp:Transcript_30419/g.74041  ORF Transcript_30419/g.74041 Transcript_30419/m.74041 type:complete len:301 (-) Transcript_30419:257-1159(-)